MNKKILGVLTLSRLAAATFFLLALVTPAHAKVVPPAEEGWAHVNGVNLHYKIQGVGDAVVFVHGLLQNYQMWDPYMGALISNYRVLTYSRRYNWPNHNKFDVPDDAAGREADDLYWMIRYHRLNHVNLVGHCYGAIIALKFAVKHPDMVHSLTICEPPLAQWFLDMPETQPAWGEFLNKAYVPTQRDMLLNRPEQAARTFANWLQPGWFDSLSQTDLEVLTSSCDDLKSLILSTGGYPTVSHSDLQQVNCPALLITGEKTLPFYMNVQKQLSVDLGNVPIVTIPGASHNVVVDQPDAVLKVLTDFLAQHVRR